MLRRTQREGHRLIAVLSACGMLGVLAATLGGCPIYSADSCAQDPSCNPPVDTTDASPGRDCRSTGCNVGYSCSYLSTGRYECIAYDCRASERACAAGQTCVGDASGVYKCTTSASDAGKDASDAGTDSGPLDCRKTGCIGGYKCSNDPSGAFSCTSTDPLACAADGDCTSKTGAGSLCLGGVCKAPKDLCSDSTQCKSGKVCVDGRCADACTTGGAACSTGYACVSGACIGGTGACGASSSGDAGVDGSSDGAADAGPKTCSKGTCVATRCVSACAVDGSCPSGQVCAGGGCVVDDRPVFFCDKLGTADGTQDACAAGSMCLHHNCYLACTGPTDTTSCTEPKYPVCKSVTTSSGQHSVCGSNTNLGADCDPTRGLTCSAGKFCIDGFCK